MGRVLYSTNWVKTYPNTSHYPKHNQNTWAATALPPSGFTLSIAKATLAWPQLLALWLLWVCCRCQELGLALLLLVPLSGAPMETTSKNRERVGVSTLGGCCLVLKCHSQPRFGISSERYLREEAQPGLSPWRCTISLFGAMIWTMKIHQK